MKTIFIFANPDFEKKYKCGISRLYNIFFKKYNFNLEVIDEEFLKNHVPEDDSSQILVIAGGDGTIHRVINTIPGNVLEKYIFGIIPTGTANEFAKSLNLSFFLEENAEIIANKKNIKRIKIGVINQKYIFTTGFLYGISCKVLEETSDKAKHYLGTFAYQLPGLITIGNYSDFIKNFNINSLNFKTGYLLINTATLLSKNISVGNIENEDSNRLSVVYLDSDLNTGDFIRLLAKNQTKSNILHDPAVFYKQMDKLNLDFEGNIHFMLDGEVYNMSAPLKFEHYQHEIRIIV